MRLLKRGLRVAIGVFAILAALSIGLDLVLGPPGGRIHGAPIPYEHLANERRDPFRSLYRVERLHEIARFRTVRDCLVPSQARAVTPDLRRVAWRRIRSSGDAEVCLHRIASSYGTPERVEAWMQAAGLDTRVYPSIRDEIVVAGFRSLDGISLSHLGGTTVLRWLAGLFPYVESFTVTFSAQGEVISTRYGANIL